MAPKRVTIVSLVDSIRNRLARPSFKQSVTNCFVKLGLWRKANLSFNKYNGTLHKEFKKRSDDLEDQDYVDWFKKTEPKDSAMNKVKRS